ncbi:DNA-binding protein [Tricharina praecox]|uniref:DNA-binding protein n=1 Tax=Tricharina praecox TaxID=43433 RepID=UPI00221FCD58|nr:DNA-binding protein [Tricharina praecox]KAI5851842.1 DNA-binding protein [Tricharina praecox]
MSAPAAAATGKPKTKKSSKAKSSTAADDGRVHKLSLKGSSKLVSEFFEYSINSILFQRGVYPAEDFAAVKKYGLNMLVTADDQVRAYIRRIMSQLHRWMAGGKISKLVVVIASKDTGEPLERWQFDVQLLQQKKQKAAAVPEIPDENGVAPETEPAAAAAEVHKDKTEKEIQEEIQSLFRQITASVTFLPMLDGRCTFNVLVYADGDADVPMEWGDSDAREIVDGEKVTLRSWGTSSHRVDTLVSYKLAD